MNDNCLSYWFPMLQATGAPVPRTEIIRYAGKRDDLVRVLDGDTPDAWPKLLEDITAAAARMGFPCFLRTGQGSGKHEWSRCCHLPNAAAIPQHVANLVEWSNIVDFFGLPTNVWAVRELLPVTPAFIAHGFRDMPVTRERRYFLADHKVHSHVPYWPEEAMIQGCRVGWNKPPEGCTDFVELDYDGDTLILSPADWREKLAAVNTETPEEVSELTALTARVAAAFDGAYSLDWLYTDKGWYAIDMAIAADSWACPDDLKQAQAQDAPGPLFGETT